MQLDDFNSGDRMIVQLKDGSEFAGKFVGLKKTAEGYMLMLDRPAKGTSFIRTRQIARFDTYRWAEGGTKRGSDQPKDKRL